MGDKSRNGISVTSVLAGALAHSGPTPVPSPAEPSGSARRRGEETTQPRTSLAQLPDDSGHRRAGRAGNRLVSPRPPVDPAAADPQTPTAAVPGTAHVRRVRPTCVRRSGTTRVRRTRPASVRRSGSASVRRTRPGFVRRTRPASVRRPRASLSTAHPARFVRRTWTARVRRSGPGSVRRTWSAGAFGEPGALPVPAKKSRKWLIVGITAGVLALLAGGGVTAAVLVARDADACRAHPRPARPVTEFMRGRPTATATTTGRPNWSAVRHWTGSASTPRSTRSRSWSAPRVVSSPGPDPTVTEESEQTATVTTTVKLTTNDERVSSVDLRFVVVRNDRWLVCEVS